MCAASRSRPLRPPCAGRRGRPAASAGRRPAKNGSPCTWSQCRWLTRIEPRNAAAAEQRRSATRSPVPASRTRVGHVAAVRHDRDARRCARRSGRTRRRARASSRARRAGSAAPAHSSARRRQARRSSRSATCRWASSTPADPATVARKAWRPTYQSLQSSRARTVAVLGTSRTRSRRTVAAPSCTRSARPATLTSSALLHDVVAVARLALAHDDRPGLDGVRAARWASRSRCVHRARPGSRRPAAGRSPRGRNTAAGPAGQHRDASSARAPRGPPDGVRRPGTHRATITRTTAAPTAEPPSSADSRTASALATSVSATRAGAA